MDDTHIACCGTAVLDMFLHSPFARKGQLESVERIDYGAGGLACAVSIGLAQLGLPVEAIGMIGRDYFGQVLRDRLVSLGVGVSELKESSKHHTALSVIIVSPDGERTVYFSRGANEEFGPACIDPAAFHNCRICHFGYPCIMPSFRGTKLASFFRALQESGVITSLDTTWSSAAEPLADLEAALPFTDIFTPNLDEALHLSGTRADGISKEQIEQAGEFFLGRGVKVVVITLGRNGSYLASSREMPGDFSHLLPPAGIRISCPAFGTRGNLNATGAGDFFAAGFLAGLFRGVSPQVALQAGNLAAALHMEGSEIPHFEKLIPLIEQRPLLEAA